MRAYAGANGPIISRGAMVTAAIAKGGGARAKIVGKPSRAAVAEISARLGLPTNELAVIGDDLGMDIALGRLGGSRTVLVRSGISGAIELDRLPAHRRPDAVLDGVADLTGMAVNRIELDQRELLAGAGLTVAGLYDELTDRMTRSVRARRAHVRGRRARAGPRSDAGRARRRARATAGREARPRARPGTAAGGVPRAPASRARHLLGAMLEPTPLALARLDELRRTGTVDLGPARVTRQGKAGILELLNPRHLNAEDGTTLGPTEAAVDLILLDPEIEIGVFRGGPVEHPRYAGERVFGSGINLTHLYRGRIDFLFYLVRDLGYVNKLYRGLRDGQEKLWIAAVERFAIGGPASCCTSSTTCSRRAARGCTCRRARRGSSPAHPTSGCRGSSATARRGRRSCPGASGSRANPTRRCCATRSSSRRSSRRRWRRGSRR